MKDKFILYKVRGYKFIKENKLILSVLFLFLVTAVIIYKIVFASPEYNNRIYIDSVMLGETITGSSPFDSTEAAGNDLSASDSVIRTFDTLEYIINYQMKVMNENHTEALVGGEPLQDRFIRFEVAFPLTASVIWNKNNERANYSYETSTNTLIVDVPKTVIIESSPVETERLSFQVLANQNLSVVSPLSIKVYETTINKDNNSAGIKTIESSEELTQVKVSAKESVSVNFVDGFAFADEEVINGKKIEYGVTLSLKPNAGEKGIKGVTYPETIAFKLKSKQENTSGNENGELNYIASAIYDKRTGLFNIPNGKIIEGYNSTNAVFASGIIEAAEISEDVNANEQEITFEIMNIKTNGIFPSGNNDLDGFVLGTYSVQLASIRGQGAETSDYNVTSSLIGSEGVEVIAPELIANKFFSIGKQILDLETKTETTLKDTNYFTDGEAIVVSYNFKYSKDGDLLEDPVTGSISLPEGFIIESYDENISDSDYKLISNKELDNLLVTYCVINGECYDSISEFFEEEAENLEDIKIKINYTLDSLDSGTEFKMLYRIKLADKKESSSYIIQSDVTGGNELNDKIFTLSKSTTLNYVPFKSRVNLKLKNDTYNSQFQTTFEGPLSWEVNPYVTIPTILTSGNLLEISKINLIVSIPKGLTYVENLNYVSPETVNLKTDGTTELIYNLTGYKVNDYIEPINFDTNIGITSSGNKEVTVVISATNNAGGTDTSSLIERTNKKSIFISSPSSINYRQQVETPVVLENQDIAFSTTVYNGSETAKEISVINILPYLGDGDSLYSGNYETTILTNDNVLCSSDIASVITTDILGYNGWVSCDTLDKNKITAFKHTKNILNDKTEKFDFKINPLLESNPDDKFASRAYIVYNSTAYKTNTVIANIKSIKVSGVVWEDFNADGIMTDDERKIEGIVLKLYKQIGEFNNSESNEFVSETVSGKNGKYEFSGLEPDQLYYINAEYNNERYYVTIPVATLNQVENSMFMDDILNLDATFNPEKYAENPTISIAFGGSFKTNINNSNIKDINLGLAVRKNFSLSINKYINKVTVKNNGGKEEVYDFGRSKLAKIDVKNIEKASIKVVYTLELENVKFYPGYALSVKDYIPYGMEFNEAYPENKGWEYENTTTLTNKTLAADLIDAGEKKYLTIAFDLVLKEAGEFINSASIYDLQPLDLQPIDLLREQSDLGLWGIR